MAWKVKGIGDIEDGLYVLNLNANQQQARIQTMSAVKITNADPALWHMRLGHVPMRVLRKIKEFSCNSFHIDQSYLSTS